MNELLRRILFLPPQSSTVARELDYLHYSVILVTMIGAAGVALTGAYFVLRYRKSARRADVAPDPSPEHGSGGISYRVELGFIALLLTLFVGWWVIGFRQFVHLEVPPANAIEIYVSAKQWMWSFAYANGAGSNGVLYVPARRPIKLIMSSRDVIHSFFVPHFRVKKDVVPGRVTTLWFEVREPGSYPVYCTEYCGTGHSTMRATVIALDELDYVERLRQLPRLQIQTVDDVEPAVVGRLPEVSLSLAQMGQRVAIEHGCLRCHTTDGTPHIGPSWAGVYDSSITLEDGQRVTADAAYLTESMMDPLAKLRRGFAPVMPAYQGILDAPQTGALLEYIRSLPAAESANPASPLPPPGSPALRLPGAADAGFPELPP